MWSGMCIGVFGVYWYLNVVRDVHWSIWSLLVLECGQGCALEYLESTGTRMWSGICIGVFGVYWYLNVVRDVHWSIWSLLVLECGQGCALEYL